MKITEPWDPLGRYFVRDLVDDLFEERTMTDGYYAPMTKPPFSAYWEGLGSPPAGRQPAESAISGEPEAWRQIAGMLHARLRDCEIEGSYLSDMDEGVCRACRYEAERILAALAPSDPVQPWDTVEYWKAKYIEIQRECGDSSVEPEAWERRHRDHLRFFTDLCEMMADELGIERTWVKDLHPMDILEKHIFRALAPSDPLSAATHPAMSLVNIQAEDEGLWFKAKTAAEAYLQQALRKLHGAVEADPVQPWDTVEYWKAKYIEVRKECGDPPPVEGEPESEVQAWVRRNDEDK